MNQSLFELGVALLFISRMHSGVNLMSSRNNRTLSRLTEYLRQSHHWDSTRRHEVLQNVSRPHAGELVDIASSLRTRI